MVEYPLYMQKSRRAASYGDGTSGRRGGGMDRGQFRVLLFNSDWDIYATQVDVAI